MKLIFLNPPGVVFFKMAILRYLRQTANAFVATKVQT